MEMPFKRAKKNPLQKTASVLLPPAHRSRRAHLLIPVAGRGAFELQTCADCGKVSWPMHEACPHCLSADLPLRPVSRGGVLISSTTAEVPADSYFRDRAPWRVGLVQMDAGPQALAHLHPKAVMGDRLRLSLILDRAGQAVLHAAPEQERDMSQDPQWQEMSADPRGRRVLITDARHPAALPLAEALLKAGAVQVYLGVDELWKPLAGRDKFEAMSGVTLVDLDLRSDRSVADLARNIGAKIEILINTADLQRAGGVMAPASPAHTREMLEVATFGLIRLMRNFAPIMAMRGGDGRKDAPGAVAWVNLVSVFGIVAHPAYSGYGAAHAAALALRPALRGLLAGGGVRLMTAITGPTDTPWFDAFPHPKVNGRAIATAILAGLKAGHEEAVIGDLAKDWLARHEDNPRALEAELARGQL